MYGILKSILSNKYYASLTVLTFWIIIYFPLSWISSENSKIWIKLEYIWIIIGIIGVMAIVDENRKNIAQTELKYHNYWIENDYNGLLNYLNSQNNCIQFNYNMNLYSKVQFDSLQNRQDIFCLWSKKASLYVNSCFNTESKAIGEIPLLTLKNKEDIYPYNEIIILKRKINQNLEIKKEYEKIIGDSFWSNYKLSYGLLLIYFAFSLRLAITTNKLRIKKSY